MKKYNNELMLEAYQNFLKIKPTKKEIELTVKTQPHMPKKREAYQTTFL